ncbi:MAG: cyclic nucleotide-binding domain-containing protein [Candidatus Eremiobacterota bacterium]
MEYSYMTTEKHSDYGKTSNYLLLEEACEQIIKDEITENEFLSTLRWIEDLIEESDSNEEYVNDEETGSETLISAKNLYMEGIEIYEDAIYELKKYLKNRDLSHITDGLSMALEANRKLLDVQNIAGEKVQQLEESEKFLKQQQMLKRNMSGNIFSTLNYINPGNKVFAGQSRNKADIFSITPLFDVLTNDQMEKISGRIKHKRYEKNAILFNEGDNATEVYIIKTGEIKLYNPLVCDSKIEFPLLSTGNVLGEMGIITGAPRSLSAIVSSEKAELYIISRDDFMYILKSCPEVNINLSRILCERISETNKRLLEYLL